MIDLHVHLDGSLSFEMVRKLAKLQQMEEYGDEILTAKMVAPANCKDLNDYLTKFDYPLRLLQTKSALEISVYELLKLQEKQGLRYADIRFAPQLHMQKGLVQQEVVEAVLRGRNRFLEEASQMKAGIILCCMRGAEERVNVETVELAAQYRGKGVSMLDLAGAEALFPTKNYKQLFVKAESLNVPCTIHAGEAAGPESVWHALEFGAGRIGHGVRSIEDKELVRRLAKDQIPLEMCPTSNLNTKMFSSIEEYPILQLLDAGVKVTINTDNTTVSNTTLEKEMKLIQKTFHLSENEMKGLVKNAEESIVF